MAAGSQSSSARGPTAASSHGSPPPSGLVTKKVMLHNDGKSFNLSENSCSSTNNGVVDQHKNTDNEKVEENGQDKPELDIVINNVVCSFNVRCHLNLRDIALRGLNVEYRKENGVRSSRFTFPSIYSAEFYSLGV